MDYSAEYRRWLTDPVFDEETRREVSLITDRAEIEDRFSKNLSFGTGGLRGVMGAGPNRLNRYTVGKATQGLCDYINSLSAGGAVVIAYDSRNHSEEFARDAALIFAANGIKALIFESLRPTPELSFAVRGLGAAAGIVITASHNPPEYNGYKVYLADGGQIVPPFDRLIIEKVNAVEDYSAVKRISKEEAKSRGLYAELGGETDDKYIAAVKSLVINKEAVKKFADKIKIVYTPLNGTGYVPVLRILKELGFTHVYTVPEQSAPDGNFPTLAYPNPEEEGAFELALELAAKEDADLVLATDPDADRLGVYAKDGGRGKYYRFTGNSFGILLAEYLLSERKKRGLLPENPADGAVISTIVSSDMIFPVAAEYGVTVIRTLTGFKYAGEQMERFERARLANGGALCAQKGAYEFLYAFEESYGCLTGGHARDKDAVSAVAALCEAACAYKERGMTLADAMRLSYAKYGYFEESQLSCRLSEGMDAGLLCGKLRSRPPETFGGFKVLSVADYKSGEIRFADGSSSSTGLPVSNVLELRLENGCRFCVRPSGTEPKIKMYFFARGGSRGEALANSEKLKKAAENFFEL